MAYDKQTWVPYDPDLSYDQNKANGGAVSADRLNNMETGISNNDINKVNVADMRKPASDVAGIEEVSTLQTQVDNSAVGTNLLTNSNFSSGLSNFTVNTGTNSDCKAVVTTDSDGDTCVHITGTGAYCGLYCTPVSFNRNQVTTGSVLAKGTGTLNWVGLSDRPTSNFGTISTESYSKVGSTGQATSSTNSFCVYFNHVNGVVDIYIKFLKLEKGIVATDWCPNPEDKADDSKVVHLSGANNFDTVPTVNNNPLLLASSLPSDLARTGQDQEFTGKNTFDTAPIDKTTGNPYITKDGVPSDVARTGQANTFNLTQTFSQGVKTLQTGSYSDVNSLVNEGLYFNTNLSIKNGAGDITAGFIQVISGYWARVRQIMYSDVVNNLVYTRISSDSGSTWSNWVQIITSDQIPTDLARTGQAQTFTAAQTFSIAPTITDASTDKGDNQAATMADLKSLENSAWRVLKEDKVVASGTCPPITAQKVLYQIDSNSNRLNLSVSFRLSKEGVDDKSLVTLDFSGVIKNITGFKDGMSNDMGIGRGGMDAKYSGPKVIINMNQQTGCWSNNTFWLSYDQLAGN